jgi:peptidoglycan/xylan/chitin deacetylase (PgdA/CDA1 family)
MLRQKNLVGLSFDDGPNSQNIEVILDILEKNNCQATFFWIVEYAQRLSKENSVLFQKIISRINNSGHEIGLHAPGDFQPTLRSRFLSKFTKKELATALGELEKLTRLKIKLYRPHYVLQPLSMLFAEQLGLRVVLGDFIHYSNPSSPKQKQIEKYSTAKPGNILIFHDGITQTRKTNYILDVLPEVLLNLRKRNLIPTKVSNLI